MGIGRREGGLMDQFGLNVHTDMDFIAKLLSAVFLCGGGIGVDLSGGLLSEFLALFIR